MSMEKRQKDIDEMVALIESLMENGSMHVSVKADDEAADTTVSTACTNECAGGACMQPTEKQELSQRKNDSDKNDLKQEEE